MKCIVIHRHDQNNVGDMASNPLQYFMDPEEYEIVDITKINRMNFDENIPIIIGGGGLIENTFIGDSLREFITCYDESQLLETATSFWPQSSNANKTVRDEFFTKLNALVKEYLEKLSNKKSARILWGVGHNKDYQKHSEDKIKYPKWLRMFDSVGIRDYNQEYEWVPCASCMHPALRKTYTIRNDVIWFEHKKQLIKSLDFGSDPIPRYINSGNNIEQTIELLGSANTIMTNSYHGAFWGTLLKKRVIVVGPWSSKFNAMKHAPTFIEKGIYWKNIIDDIPVYDTALEECIDVTEEYWNKVKEMIK